MVFPYLKGLIVIKFRDFAYCSCISVVVLLYLVFVSRALEYSFRNMR
jgi:hypothetical protein